MWMRVHILGTASGRPTATRDVSGTLIQTPYGTIAIDPGEGFQQRLIRQKQKISSYNNEWKLKLSKIDTVLLTHGHLDHIGGLLPMIHSMGLDGRKKELNIFGPARNEKEKTPLDLENQFEIMKQMGATEKILGYPINFKLVNPNQNQKIILSNTGLEGIAYSTHHKVQSCAWKIQTPIRRGTINGPLLDKLSFSNSERAELFEKGRLVRKDGKKYLEEDFKGKTKRGLSVVISGDTSGYNCDIDKIKSPIDLYIHEATYLKEQRKRADLYLHSTAEEAGIRAAACNARMLVLTHFSSRLLDTRESVKEAKQKHHNTSAAEDGDLIIITKEKISHLRILNQKIVEINLT